MPTFTVTYTLTNEFYFNVEADNDDAAREIATHIITKHGICDIPDYTHIEELEDGITTESFDVNEYVED